jgi:pyruvate,water dikinase
MIVHFAEATSRDSVGCKAHNLAVMWQAGLPVPEGFCVTAAGINTLDSAGLSCALARLQSNAFAVRSSAIEEDAIQDSFAGILASRLNVTTTAGVLSALADIRDSTLAPAAARYSQRRNRPSVLRIAAIVQSFVPADASGVLFMRDPLTGAAQVVVEGCWGLGPGTVEGLVLPDRWLMSAAGEVISSHIADKDVAVVPNETGGTIQRPVDSGRRRRPCISPVVLQQLARLAAECERLFRGPQDIEWAVSGEQVWLLQSRPITVRR